MNNLLSGAELEVKEVVGGTVTLTTTSAKDYRFAKMLPPKHTCGKSNPLQVGDTVRVTIANPGVAVRVRRIQGPCACEFALFYDEVPHIR